MALVFERNSSSVEVQVTDKTSTAVKSVVKAIAGDLPEAHWSPAVATQGEIAEVVRNIINTAKEVHEQ